MEAKANGIGRSVVGIGSVCVGSNSTEMIAYAIGSCIALCLYDHKSGIGAMAHILLPSADTSGHENSDMSASTKYADHALDLALQKMLGLGAHRNGIRAGIVGGAEMFTYGSRRSIDIGGMNILSVTEELKKRNIPLSYSVTGGKRSRTVTFRIPGTGFEEQISIKSPQMPR